MLIKGILDAFYSLIDSGTQFIDLPSFSQDFLNQLWYIRGYLIDGVYFIRYWTHFEYLLTLFLAVISVEVGYLAYKTVMWILRKIPFVSIK